MIHCHVIPVFTHPKKANPVKRKLDKYTQSVVNVALAMQGTPTLSAREQAMCAELKIDPKAYLEIKLAKKAVQR